MKPHYESFVLHVGLESIENTNLSLDAFYLIQVPFTDAFSLVIRI